MQKLVQVTLLQAARLKFPEKQTGRPRESAERLLRTFLVVLQTGMPWRFVQRLKDPVDYRTAHRHFLAWARAGVFELAYRNLYRLLTRRRRRATRHVVLDTSYVRNVFGEDVLGKNHTDRGRLGSKVFACVDDRGLPLTLSLYPANASDHTILKQEQPLRHVPKGARVYADRGFDSKRARAHLSFQGLRPRIARRGARYAPRPWDESRRRTVELFFGRLDRNRRLIVRYERTAVAYLGFTWLASMRVAGQVDQI